MPPDDHSSADEPDGVADITIRRHALRRRIMVVARQLFARSGYERVSLDDVAYGAELERADVSRFFRHKDALLAAVLDDSWEDVLPRLKDIAATSVTAHSAILSIFAFMANGLQRDEELFRVVLFEGRRSSPESDAVGLSGGYRSFVQIHRDLVARGQRDGSFRAIHHPYVAASMLVGALEGMLRDRLAAAQDRSTTPYSGTYLMQAFDALVTSLKN